MKILGCCLGPTQNDGNEICQAILYMNTQVIPRRSLCRLRPNELAPSNKSETQKLAVFDETIQLNLGDLMTTPKLISEEKPQTLECFPDNDEQQGSDFLPKSYAIDATGEPKNQKFSTDLLINSEVMLSQWGE